jgi:hypothetical protein
MERAERILRQRIVRKRDIFAELMEGVAAIKSNRAGKITLRSYKLDLAPLPKLSGTPS